jgi:carbonic anhydrase/acetyltransferase-like protein (isoleucine patch superfamily)
MILSHQGKSPSIANSAYIAPNATVCGNVIIGEECSVMFGAVITADGGPVTLGKQDVIMEGAVIRGTKKHPAELGDNILVGPHAYLSGCAVEDNVFIATGASVFNGAKIESRCEIRVNGVVHINTRLPSDTHVPIGWVAVGDPVEILPTSEHEKIWSIQKELNFSKTVWGLKRPKEGDTIMPQITSRYSRYVSKHKSDKILRKGWREEKKDNA